MDQTREFWSLIGDLQREKKDLCRERDMWRDKYLMVTGQGNWTYPPPPQVEESKEESNLEPLGKHVSIMGLRAKHEIAMRELAKKNSEERNDTA